jgi:ABC-type multidrug transport system fused ATPase/permease subunit
MVVTGSHWVTLLGVMFRTVGALSLGASLLFTWWWVLSDRRHKAWAMTMGLVGMFVGYSLILNDRITELTVPAVGTIKAAADQAQSEVQAISKLREQMETQAKTILELRAATHEAADKVASAQDEVQSLNATLTSPSLLLRSTTFIWGKQGDVFLAGYHFSLRIR